MNKLLKVNCPQCDKVFSYYDSEFRPFCCERCKMIDLGHWFEESYRLPTKETIRPDQNKENKQNESQSQEDHEEDQYSDPDQFEDDENNY